MNFSHLENDFNCQITKQDRRDTLTSELRGTYYYNVLFNETSDNHLKSICFKLDNYLYYAESNDLESFNREYKINKGLSVE